MSVVAIILARKNSKGLKNKNIKLLNGKPLIYHSIDILKKSRLINDIIVSSDSKKIRDMAIKRGVKAPFLRPKSLSTDNATSDKALRHCLKFLNKKKLYPKIVVYLQITEPLRKLWMIEKCIKVLKKRKEIDTAFMVKKFYKNLWEKNKKNYIRTTNEKYGLPRQKKSKYFREDTGWACATRSSVILKGSRIGKKIFPVFYNHDFDYLDIHNNNDLKIANFILKKKLFKII